MWLPMSPVSAPSFPQPLCLTSEDLCAGGCLALPLPEPGVGQVSPSAPWALSPWHTDEARCQDCIRGSQLVGGKDAEGIVSSPRRLRPGPSTGFPACSCPQGSAGPQLRGYIKAVPSRVHTVAKTPCSCPRHLSSARDSSSQGQSSAKGLASPLLILCSSSPPHVPTSTSLSPPLTSPLPHPHPPEKQQLLGDFLPKPMRPKAKFSGPGPPIYP